MTAAELTTRLSEASGANQGVVKVLLKTLGSIVQDTLKAGGEVSLPGLGKMTVADRAARTGKNPRTGEAVDIAAKRVPKFKPSTELRNALG